MPSPIFAHVRGIPGSGKTWLCKELRKKGIICIDTDDLLEETFNDLFKTSKSFRRLIELPPSPDSEEDENTWDKVVRRESLSRLSLMIKRARKQKQSLVVVGITLGPNIEGLDGQFFLKMSDRALEIAYRRLLRREVAKISDRLGLINQIINNERLNSVGPVLISVINPALEITTTFYRYKGIYDQAVNFEKKRKTVILSQPEIIRRLS